MLRKTMLALALLAVLGFGFAQVTVSPTPGTGDDQISKGSTSADVDQTVELILPQATALHLAANTITFDLKYLDGPDWKARAEGDQVALDALSSTYDCVYVAGDDAPKPFGTTYWNQTMVVPGEVAYLPTSWDKIELIYIDRDTYGTVRKADDGDRVVTYPPIRLDENGLVPGSKDYFVCYQTFVIQLFSNFEKFDLQVERNDMDATKSIEHLYVQGNTCAEFGAGTGLYDLPNGEFRHLLPTNLIAGPTGTRDQVDADGNPTGACNSNSSWMDVLGVLAVKINADRHGTSIANLTYTLLSTDTTFTDTTY